MDDKPESGSDEADAIPTLEVRARTAEKDQGEPLTDLAPLVDRIAARVDRALEHEFEQSVTRPLNDALHQALASYQKQVRVVLLRELLEELSEDHGPDKPR